MPVLNAFRSILHLLVMGLTLMPWALAAVLLSVWVRGPRLYWFCTGWMRVVVWSARWILGIRVRVTGREHLPVGGQAAAVLLSKHQSAFETFLLPTLMPHPLAYVFKRELLYVPFFGWAIGRLDMVHIDRGKRAQAFARVVAQGRKLLAKGVWVTMFPEGTRIARGKQGSYKSGGTRLAIQAGVPVIPIALTSARCWPPRAIFKQPGCVEVSIGPPIASQGRRPDELMQEVQAWIEAEMRRLDPEAYAAQRD